MSRANLGLNRKKCPDCGHRMDMHLERDGATYCVVCERSQKKCPPVEAASK